MPALLHAKKCPWPTLAGLLLCLILASPASAAVINWTGAGDGISWIDVNNWDTPNFPGASDDPTFNTHNGSINLGADRTVNGLDATSSNLSFSDGYDLIVADTLKLFLDVNLDMNAGALITADSVTVLLAGGTSNISNWQTQGAAYLQAPIAATISSAISGTGDIFIINSSDLTLTGLNTYTGITSVTSGTLTALGAGNILPSTTTLWIDTLGLCRLDDQAVDALYVNGDLEISGPLTFNSGACYDDISGSGSLIKQGSGSFTMDASCNCTLSAPTTVTSGSLTVQSPLYSTEYNLSGGQVSLTQANLLPSTSSITMGSGAELSIGGNDYTISSLSGQGSVTASGGALTINTALTPGLSAGAITICNFVLDGGASFNVEINGGTAGTGYDQVIATGDVTLGGSLNVTSTYTPYIGDEFVIINKTSSGPMAGAFTGLNDGDIITAGSDDYEFHYAGGDGNDVVLIALTGRVRPDPDPPDPSTDPPSPPPVSHTDSPTPTGSLNGPSLNWPQVADADFYRVYRADCPVGCERIELDRMRGTSFIDQSALPGLVYYYFIRSENDNGLSDFSDWIAAWRYEQNPGRAGDFNQDGIMDLAWWEENTNQLIFWLMLHGEVQAVYTRGLGLDISQWLWINTGDFNANGLWDLLWWNPAAGEVISGFEPYEARPQPRSSTQSGNSSVLGTISGNAVLSYTGDMNGDGRCDILWRDHITGQVTLWIMGEDGMPALKGPPTLASGMTSGGKPGVTDSLEWKVRGLHDMDGDNKADLVWQHAYDGRVVIWRLDGSQAMGIKEYQRGDALNWRVAGLGDLNGDGSGDIVWRNDANGQVQAWLLDGGDTSYAQRGIAMGAEALIWQVKEVGNFCELGRDDVYCKNSGSGAARIFTLDGREFTPGVE